LIVKKKFSENSKFFRDFSK